MSKLTRTMTLVCLGAIALSGCELLSPKARIEATAPEVTFHSSANPPWSRLHVGKMVCAEGKSFSISRAEENNELDMHWEGKQYTLHRIQTTTGAYRYEDATSGLVLIQIPVKTLLLNSKLGQRVTDECNPG